MRYSNGSQIQLTQLHKNTVLKADEKKIQMLKKTKSVYRNLEAIFYIWKNAVTLSAWLLPYLINTTEILTFYWKINIFSLYCQWKSAGKKKKTW